MVERTVAAAKAKKDAGSGGATFTAGGGTGAADGFGYMADSAAAAEDEAIVVTGNPIRRRGPFGLYSDAERLYFARSAAIGRLLAAPASPFDGSGRLTGKVTMAQVNNAGKAIAASYSIRRRKFSRRLYLLILKTDGLNIMV